MKNLIYDNTEQEIKQQLEEEIQKIIAKARNNKQLLTKEDIERLESLTKVRNEYKRNKIFKDVDINTLLKIGAGTVLTLAVLNYEKEDIITTKSYNIVTRLIGF